VKASCRVAILFRSSSLYSRCSSLSHTHFVFSQPQCWSLETNCLIIRLKGPSSALWLIKVLSCNTNTPPRHYLSSRPSSRLELSTNRFFDRPYRFLLILLDFALFFFAYFSSTHKSDKVITFVIARKKANLCETEDFVERKAVSIVVIGFQLRLKVFFRSSSLYFHCSFLSLSLSACGGILTIVLTTLFRRTVLSAYGQRHTKRFGIRDAIVVLLPLIFRPVWRQKKG